MQYTDKKLNSRQRRKAEAEKFNEEREGLVTFPSAEDYKNMSPLDQEKVKRLIQYAANTIEKNTKRGKISEVYSNSDIDDYN